MTIKSAMLTRDEWGKYKKSKKVPDGIGGKIELGPILEKYAKSKKTQQDFDALESKMKLWLKVALAGEHKSHANHMRILLDEERQIIQTAYKDEADKKRKDEMRLKLAPLVSVQARLAGYLEAISKLRNVFEAEANSALGKKRLAFVQLIRKDLTVADEHCVGHMTLHKAGMLAKTLKLRDGSEGYDSYKSELEKLVDEMKKGLTKFANIEGL